MSGASTTGNALVLRPDGKPYLNTASCWALLVNAARDARYHKLVPEDAFVDRRNPEPIEYFAPRRDGRETITDDGLVLSEPSSDFPDLPALAFEGAAYGPPVMVEVWVEKTTTNDLVLPLARRYGANLITGAGEMSVPAVRDFMRRVRAAGVPARILYISDFDPGGRSMPVAVARKIEFALQEGDDLDITLDPVLLTEEQSLEYGLPRTPIKDTERRGARFEARFGAGATELDALEALHPGELARIVSGRIERHLDPDHRWAFNAALHEHQAELRAISAQVHAHYSDDVARLEQEYAALVADFRAWRQRAENVFEQIIERLGHADPPPFEAPAPRPPDEPDDPLFYSGRDYLTQIEHYHRWQGRARP